MKLDTPAYFFNLKKTCLYTYFETWTENHYYIHVEEDKKKKMERKEYFCIRIDLLENDLFWYICRLGNATPREAVLVLVSEFWLLASGEVVTWSAKLERKSLTGSFYLDVFPSKE